MSILRTKILLKPLHNEDYAFESKINCFRQRLVWFVEIEVWENNQVK